ncbi:hypothetical protein LSAJ160_200042 [Latilactobacillus sakei]|nr:hypothetical protein LSAJ160_200042 [Latilactobacillus sakei]
MANIVKRRRQFRKARLNDKISTIQKERKTKVILSYALFLCP